MAGSEWPFTGLGRTFFDGTLPQLVKNIGRIADELKRFNDKAAAENAIAWPPPDEYKCVAPDNAEKCVDCNKPIFYAEKWGYIHYDGSDSCEFPRPQNEMK